MHIVKLQAMIVVVAVVGGGCGDVAVQDGVGATSQVSQDLSECRLDCPSGEVFTCATLPCSVTSTTLTCNGTTTSCPACVPQTCESVAAQCGQTDDGCGGTLDCGECGLHEACVDNFCGRACPTGRFDCCHDGACLTITQCNLAGC